MHPRVDRALCGDITYSHDHEFVPYAIITLNKTGIYFLTRDNCCELWMPPITLCIALMMPCSNYDTSDTSICQCVHFMAIQITWNILLAVVRIYSTMYAVIFGMCHAPASRVGSLTAIVIIRASGLLIVRCGWRLLAELRQGTLKSRHAIHILVDYLVPFR